MVFVGIFFSWVFCLLYNDSFTVVAVVFFFNFFLKIIHWLSGFFKLVRLLTFFGYLLHFVFVVVLYYFRVDLSYLLDFFYSLPFYHVAYSPFLYGGSSLSELMQSFYYTIPGIESFIVQDDLGRAYTNRGGPSDFTRKTLDVAQNVATNVGQGAAQAGGAWGIFKFLKFLKCW
jgi:hypothetical protein